jgi:hypothetical protein
MNRRGFLAMLAGAIFDPERALWTPGSKLISIPPSSGLLIPPFPIPPQVLTTGAIARYALQLLEHNLAATKLNPGRSMEILEITQRMSELNFARLRARAAVTSS